MGPSLGGNSRFFCHLQDAGRPGGVSFQTGDTIIQTHNFRDLEVHYRQPYLAHAPMESCNATARASDGRIEVWSGTQRQTRLKDAIVSALGVNPAAVVVHAELIGGSFGRRLEIDYGLEAAKLATVLQRPVQVLWTRADDIRHGFYRPGSVHRLAATLDDDGRLLHFEHRFAAQSVFRQQEPAQVTAEGADWTLAAPLVSLAYEVPSVRLEYHAVEPMVPCTWWRGTYWTNVTTATECFIDELAQLASQDPLAFRLAHLRSAQPREFVASPTTRIPFQPARMRAVLETVAMSAGWNRPPAAAHARGLACGVYDSPECYAAVIAEMQLRDGVPALSSAFVAVDVGTVVNPEVVRAQAIGGFVMGASAVMREQVTWSNGQVEQRGFEDYAVLRISECPRIEVTIVPSVREMCGVGEIVTPAAMAAVSNAFARLTNRPPRSWPLL